MKMSKFQIAGLVLIVCLATSVVFNGYLLLNYGCEPAECKSKTFVFYELNRYPFYPFFTFNFSVDYRKLILNSTEFLRVEITFNWETDNLTVIATVNDDDYDNMDSLDLLFDANEDGYFENFYRLGVDNRTIPLSYMPYLSPIGGIGWKVQAMPIPSSYHYCTFNDSGYFFHFSIPKETINFHLPMPVLLSFSDHINLTRPIEFDWSTLTAFWAFEVDE
jgi:hypothetical protein